jgi:hypothetical protein
MLIGAMLFVADAPLAYRVELFRAVHRPTVGNQGSFAACKWIAHYVRAKSNQPNQLHANRVCVRTAITERALTTPIRQHSVADIMSSGAGVCALSYRNEDSVQIGTNLQSHK